MPAPTALASPLGEGDTAPAVTEEGAPSPVADTFGSAYEKETITGEGFKGPI